MSTILDALRKLQRERSAAHPSRDLRGSVTDEIPTSRPARRSNRRGLALAAVALLFALVGGGTWLYRSGRLTRHSASQVAAQAGETREPTAEELDEVEREMDRATAAEPETPAAVAAPPAPPAPPPAAAQAPEAAPTIDAEAEARAERARLEAVQAQAAAAANAQRQAESEAAARALPPAPPPPPVPTPAPAPAVTPEPQAAEVLPIAPPQEPPAAATSAPKPKVTAKAKSKPAKPKTPEPETARREEPAPYGAGDAPEPTALNVFPPVRVESIRWHPIPERRVTSLRFEQQNVSDAHEGDIVGGVLVYRIDPGAVEIRVGSTSRVIRPTP